MEKPSKYLSRKHEREKEREELFLATESELKERNFNINLPDESISSKLNLQKRYRNSKLKNTRPDLLIFYEDPNRINDKAIIIVKLKTRSEFWSNMQARLQDQHLELKHIFPKHIILLAIAYFDYEDTTQSEAMYNQAWIRQLESEGIAIKPYSRDYLCKGIDKLTNCMQLT